MRMQRIYERFEVGLLLCSTDFSVFTESPRENKAIAL